MKSPDSPLCRLARPNVWDDNGITRETGCRASVYLLRGEDELLEMSALAAAAPQTNGGRPDPTPVQPGPAPALEAVEVRDELAVGEGGEIRRGERERTPNLARDRERRLDHAVVYGAGSTRTRPTW